MYHACGSTALVAVLIIVCAATVSSVGSSSAPDVGRLIKSEDAHAPPAYPWSAPDAAYTEILALRIAANANASAPTVADWPAAPPDVHNITQLAAGRLAGVAPTAGAWLLAAGALFFVAVPPMDPGG